MGKKELPDTKYIPGSLKSCARGQEKIREIEKYGIAAIGRSELIAYLKGKRLYASKAIRAYCYECMGYHADGKCDCQQRDCPLHPFMPYAQTSKPPAEQLDSMPAKNDHNSDTSYPPNSPNVPGGNVR